MTFIEPGTHVAIAGYDVTFEGVREVDGPNYRSLMGTLAVERAGAPVTTLFPERRSYALAQMTTTEAAIHNTLAGDLFATIAEPDRTVGSSGRWTLRILFEPLVNFIWLGAALLVLGAGFSLSDRRLRVGAPRRAARASAPALVPAE